MRRLCPLIPRLEMNTVIVVCAAALLFVDTLPAQTVVAAATKSEVVKPEKMDPKTVDTFVAYHNIYRIDVGLPNLTWSEDLARKAEVRVASCSFVHIAPGENLYAGGPISYDDIRTARLAMKHWYIEKSLVDKNWLCAWKTGRCGHYSQIVWGKTLRVGCSINHCPLFPNFVICLYDPPGNQAGMKPY